MVNGEETPDAWRNDAVHEALDLCLACKGCKSECPVHVDMATYKAELLAHYYRRRLRPRHAYVFGLIHWWARLASTMPRLVNLATHAPGLSALAVASRSNRRRTERRFTSRKSYRAAAEVTTA